LAKYSEKQTKHNNGLPTPPYPRRYLVLEKQAGLLAYGHSLLHLPIQNLYSGCSQLAPIYSGGTALDFHQLPF
jgi:hypothetical protein